MTKSSKISKTLIRETVRRVLAEAPIDDMPLKLSQVAQDIDAAKSRVTTGQEDGNPDDDKIGVTPGQTFPVGDLKPSQSSMNIGKALAQALAMIAGDMPTGGDLGAFISSDKHIMDGHHRWVATAMVDPTKEVGGFAVDMEGIPLIKILNALTVGALGIDKGKEGTGGFEQFQEGPIRKQLDVYLKDGIPGKFPKTAEWVQQAVEKFTGQKGDAAKDAAIALFLKNLTNLEFKTPDKAPERPDMPVIDPDKVKDALQIAVKALQDGNVDWNDPPFNAAPPAAANRNDEEIIPEGLRTKWQKMLK
tara:strand:+ start:96 stop:1007 length:912 start_codon:yes stop_codon:yes gene_type:complete